MGSERLPRKNALEIEPGLSLIQQAVNCARHSGVVDDICVSGDEHPALSVALFIRRPAELCGPKADIAHAVDHATEEMERIRKTRYDYVVTLQPAVIARSPLIVRDLVKGVQAYGAKGGLTMAATHRWIWRVDVCTAKNDWHGGPYPRSQDGGRTLVEINAVQVASRDVVAAGARWGTPLVSLELPPWAAALDIDTPEDMTMARDLWPWARTRLETWKGRIEPILEVHKCA
jgi:CMP-N-acetylneuraminic acid synthetase